VGFCRKGWGPGNERGGGRKRNPAGDRYRDLKQFLAKRPKGAPFCFWFGSFDPHRGYKVNSGVASGMDPAKVTLPACLPDAPVVRRDLCDYYWEVQRFDRETGEMLDALEAAGELDNTLVVMSGDNGLPFPRCKSNLYDTGARAPLAVMWKAKAKGGRVVDDFVSLADLAPTFLEAAGVKPWAAMTARSFLGVLLSGKSGRVDPKRDHVLTGKERHTCGQEGTTEGTPCRAIRTHDFLYIRNFKPHLWPAGAPEVYRDIDGSPTKTYMMQQRDEAKVKPLFDLAFGKRPAEELFDVRKDPGQLRNVADDPAYAAAKKKLAEQLMAELKATADPRVVGGGDKFDAYPYLGGGRRKPKAKGKK
ncbi:sulfatase-like hydrolase/transferase, partial [bacterium]|nr:sulfatase-like hydrolase/transferase [bacterium]